MSTSSIGIFERLGLIGLSSLEAPVLASLLTQSPLLLIGNHGSGKSLLLERIAQSLGLSWRHYNASLLNFDDLVGYPLPDPSGGLKFIQTPASIWGAQVVFLDEISRARVDIQNRLFPIIHEKKVQGLPLSDLRYRWAAMNPPPDKEAEDTDGDYSGSIELDLALADRFPFHVKMPDWSQFSEEDQEKVILSLQNERCVGVGSELTRLINEAQNQLPVVQAKWAAPVARYIRILSRILLDAKKVLSARRAAMIASNVLSIQAVLRAHQVLRPALIEPLTNPLTKLLTKPQTKPIPQSIPKSEKESIADAVWLGVLNSMPFLASGIRLDDALLLRAHKEAWKLADMNPQSELLAILNTKDPLKRVKLAVTAKDLPEGELTEIVVDVLNNLPNGARHALAEWLFESQAVAKLSVVAADEAAKAYREIACLQQIHEQVHPQSLRHQIWKHIEQKLGRIEESTPSAERKANLLASLFSKKDLSSTQDVDRVIDSFVNTQAHLLGSEV
jgi:MoxR-like ATPase